MRSKLGKLPKPEREEVAAWIYKHYNRNYLLGFLSYVILYSTYSITDYFYFPEHYWFSLVFRVIIGIPVVSLPIIFYFTGQYNKNFLIANTISSFTAPILLIVIYFKFGYTNQEIAPIYFAGIVLMIMLIGLFVYRWYVAFFSAFSIIVIYLITAVALGIYDSDSLLIYRYGLFLIVTAVTTGLISYFYQEVKVKMYLAEKEIENQNKELNQLNSSKDKLFGIIGHDLKSPLSAFTGLTKVMVEDIDELSKEELKLYSKTLSKTADNINALLENLLIWSNIQRGLVAPEKKDLSLVEIINEQFDFYSANAKNKEISLLYDIHNELQVYADKQMLHTILRNLISNALKFTERGGEIKVNAEKQNSITIISVIDSGVGIAQDHIPHLFNPAYKFYSAGTENEPTTGLGLILCKEFMDVHSGDIKIESSIGKGTTFSLIFPNS